MIISIDIDEECEAQCTILKSHVASRVLVLWQGVEHDPLRWEGQVWDIGPSETSWPLIIAISESSPRDLRLNTMTQLH